MEKAQTILKSCESHLSQTVSVLSPVDSEVSTIDDKMEEMVVQQSQVSSTVH